ncbi:hypothetical protein TNCV_3214361 [Trichonephila clavipes]|nr:hypothetical protein TNCV_3214361 [Trichonephila clavipes]
MNSAERVFVDRMTRSATKTTQVPTEVYGDEALSLARVLECHKRFSEGRESVDNGGNAGTLSPQDGECRGWDKTHRPIVAKHQWSGTEVKRALRTPCEQLAPEFFPLPSSLPRGVGGMKTEPETSIITIIYLDEQLNPQQTIICQRSSTEKAMNVNKILTYLTQPNLLLITNLKSTNSTQRQTPLLIFTCESKRYSISPA